MTVSVIVPVYNQAPFLDRCLRSVLAQTRTPDEILVVDDGSTDGSRAIMAGYGDRVVLLEQRNQGPAVARNLAFHRSTGSVIAFLDADDWWEPEKLERQLDFLARHPKAGVVHTATRFINEAGERITRPNAHLKPRIQGRCLAALLEGNPVTMSSVVVRRELLGDRPFDTTLRRATDWDLWLELAMTTEFGYLEEELTTYQFHGTNISLDLEAMTRAFEGVMARALARGLPPAEAKVATRARRRHFVNLGDLCFETGRVAEARGAYLHSWEVIRHPGALVRLAGTLMPPWMLTRARRLWWALHSDRRAVEGAR